MVRVRRNLFETNSSSTHALCIKNNPTDMEKCFELKYMGTGGNEFGWGAELYSDTMSKIVYLGIVAYHIDEVLNPDNSFYGRTTKEFAGDLKHTSKVSELDWFLGTKLEEVGVEIPSFDKEEKLESIKICVKGGYVDHTSEAMSFYRELMNNDDLLKRFLFSSQSCIITGNDNDTGYNFGLLSRAYYEGTLKTKETGWGDIVIDDERIDKDYYVFYKGN